jgi:hypothetical protein
VEGINMLNFNNHLDTITNTGTIIDNYNYDTLDSGFILPPIPNLQCLLQPSLENTRPYGGSPVFNTNSQLCGIIRHSPYCNAYTIIPTIAIIKSLELNKNMYMFNESTIFTNIAYEHTEEKGIYVVKDSITTKKLKKGYVITSINGYSLVTNDTLLINKTKQIVMPINTYIWLLSLEQLTINKVKICNMDNILQNYAESGCGGGGCGDGRGGCDRCDSINITIHENMVNNKKYVNKIKLYNVGESSFKAYEPLFTKYKGGYVLDANEHIIKLLKLNSDGVGGGCGVIGGGCGCGGGGGVIGGGCGGGCGCGVGGSGSKGGDKILLYLWNNRFNDKANKKLYFKKSKVQLLSI